MSLELVREAIRVNQVIGEDSSQTVIENDIIVPDVKPDIARVLLLDGNVSVSNADVLQDKVVVNGLVNYKILYIADEEDKSIRSINTTTNFSYSMDLLNARQGMKSKVKCDIEHIEYTLLNGRKINIKTIAKINAKVNDEIDREVVNDLRGIDDVQVLKENMSVNYYLGSNREGYVLREHMDIPAGKPSIKEILRNDLKISGKDYKITDSRVVVKGDLNISTLYVADDEERSIQFMEHEVPFTQFIELPGVDEDTACNVDFEIAEWHIEAAEDSDGELRVLNSEVSISIVTEGYNKRNLELLADAYSTCSKLGIEKQPFKLEDIAADSRSQIVLKDTLVVQDGSPDIAEVFNVICNPYMTDCKVYDDKVVIEGVVNSSVLYLADNSEQPVFCQKQEIPFRQNIDIKGIKADMGSEVSLDIDHCNYSMISSREVELRLVVCVNTKVINNATLPLVVKVGEAPLEDRRLVNQPSITIYFSQPGDTLWKVAKKYYTTVDDIKKVNNLGEYDAIVPGKQIIIPRKAQ
ncbi:MAG: DUF3794 domain-containing protein [Clostridia bacterium]|nr:DUF3794 domain-containing protein [Clostridia bacterium]